MSNKATTEIDRHIALRIRRRRLELGVSQEQLATAIGVTFQQVQKYEKGTNRISASRLHQVAAVLHVDVTFFFMDVDGAGGGLDRPPAPDLLADRAILELVRSYNAIVSSDVRSAILALTRACAGSSAVNGKRAASPPLADLVRGQSS
jgi:transcriptional regulator with XRE-family HTH domain